MNQAPTETYEEGIAFALANMTVAQLRDFARHLHAENETATIIDTVKDMAAEGLIDSGWLNDCAVEPVEQFIRECPDAAGIVDVATVAAYRPGFRNDQADWAAFEIYHRIIGVEV